MRSSPLTENIKAGSTGNVRQRLGPESRAAINILAVPQSWRNTGLYLSVYLAIAAAMLLDVWVRQPLITIGLIIFIAGRQHSLYILNHDASHYGLYRSRMGNKFVATFLSNLIMLHHPEAWSFVQWRRVHMLHHSHLFTNKDPNYMGREIQGDTRRPLSAGHLTFRCLMAGILSFWKFFMSRQDYVPPHGGNAEKNKFNHLRTLLVSFPDDPEMNTERWLKIIFFSVIISVVVFLDLWRQFILLWIVPMYTIYPMILTFFDLTEHRWTIPTQTLTVNCRSVRLGWWQRLIVSFLHRGLHLEHHIFPNVIAFDLPKLSAILERDGVIKPPIAFSGLLDDIKNVRVEA